ncbi:MAG: hypothetical protein ACOC7M_03510 [Chloroflexota bacterium]
MAVFFKIDVTSGGFDEFDRVTTEIVRDMTWRLESEAFYDGHISPWDTVPQTAKASSAPMRPVPRSKGKGAVSRERPALRCMVQGSMCMEWN